MATGTHLDQCDGQTVAVLKHARTHGKRPLSLLQPKHRTQAERYPGRDDRDDEKAIEVRIQG
jgi:hypothetical protein